MTTPALDFCQVTKRYGTNTALSDISFRVMPGEIVAFLGANGAGKSTVMSLASGLLAPTAGEVRVLDLAASDLRARTRRNVLPQELVFPMHLRVREVLETVYAHHRGADWREGADHLELGPLLERFAAQLSGGERRKLSILCALAGSPQLVLLDEPTANIDLVGQARIRALLREYFSKRGAALVFASHQMSEVDDLADRVVVLSKGKIVADDRTHAIRNRLGIRRLRYVPGDRQKAEVITGMNSDEMLKDLLRREPQAHSIEILQPSLEESILEMWQERAPL